MAAEDLAAAPGSSLIGSLDQASGTDQRWPEKWPTRWYPRPINGVLVDSMRWFRTMFFSGLLFKEGTEATLSRSET